MTRTTSLHYEVHGPSDAAATVLLSSGLGGSAGFWQPQLGALIAAGHRVIAYDQRGTGRSPATLPDAYAIADMARDVREILDATNTARCHFAGHALGGLVGLQLALDAPERIASLVLVNAWSKPNPHSARCFDARLRCWAPSARARTWKRSPSSCTPPRGAPRMRSAWPTRSTMPSRTSPAKHTMRARIAALRAFDVDARLGDIAAPTLVAAAKDDVLVPWTCSLRLADGLQNATLNLVAHGGHAHSVTEADAFNSTLLAFLSRVSAPAVPA
jgi:aminoacrylate hydrolase